MATRRVKVPSVADMMANERRGAKGKTPYEQQILQTRVKTVSRRRTASYGPHAAPEAERFKAAKNMSYETALAMQAAKEGDDSELLPYQPTPSINPPRPRTLAAGYDRDTGVMRVRFRDGAVYGYARVTPNEWRNFKRVKSPGRAINNTFDYKPYWRESWS